MYTLLLLAAVQAPCQSYRAPVGQREKGIFHLVPLTRTVQREEERPARRDAVLTWNEAVLEAIRASKTPPPMAARHLAMMHAAVYDAVNGVVRCHYHFLVDARPPQGTSAEAAAAVAAHRVLSELYPGRAKQFNALLEQSLQQVPEGRSKSDGVALGRFTADKVLEWRKDDGSARKSEYKGVAAPGVWQPTPPGFKAALFPHWPQVKCFAMTRSEQFRPRPPPALDSKEYMAAFQDVQALGGAESKVRTREQTEIALFWADGEGTATPPGHWNQIAQGVAQSRGNSLADNARLFALLNLALADAGISCWDCKFHFNFWRPIQAIREVDAEWTPLITTPPFPSYTSGHSSFSGAAAAALAGFYGTDEVRFSTTSEGLPYVTRSFKRFSEAAAEAGKSRIYGGIHWEFDNTEGLTAGASVGRHVTRHFLLPR